MSESVKEVIKVFLDKGYLINPELVEKSNIDVSFLTENLQENNSSSMLVFDENMLSSLLDKKDKEEVKEKKYGVRIIKSVEKEPKKITVQDFVMHYQKRYDSLKKILQARTDLMAPLSISRILQKTDKDKVSTIGIVSQKRYTKNGNLLFTIEDNTGMITLLVTKSKEELYRKCKDIVLDEVIGVKGVSGDKIIFLDSVFFPDIPQNDVIKKGPDDIYMAVISDIHVGSKYFLENEFLRFIDWLNGETGNSEQRELAKKVKYLFLVGDVVDGVGIYPGQEDQLIINDVVDQYNRLSELLSEIRDDINIIICPGDHDATRMAEPQPPLSKEFAGALYELKNVSLVSNPAYVNIGYTEDFEGFDVLMYHGKSFTTYSDDVESIRFSGENESDRTDMIVRFLLQKRHLAPTHGSTLFFANPNEDDHVIEKVPDFFLCGHIHKSKISQYGKVTKVAGSCWQEKTNYQVQVGHDPDPGRVPVVSLKTRDTKLLKFTD